MEARAKYLPKTVDELRVKTNPKVSYDGVTLGAYVGKGNTSSANELLQKSREPENLFSNFSKIDQILILK